MPIFEFHCEKCERDSEILVRSANWKGTKCPHCGSKRLSKQMSVFASSGARGKGGGKGGGCCGSGSCGSCRCGGGKHKH